MLQGFRNKTTNLQDTFFCVNKDLDLSAPVAIPGSVACWRLWTLPSQGLQGEKGSPGHGPPWCLHGQDHGQVGKGAAEATPSPLPSASRCQHPAARLRVSDGDGGAQQQGGDGDAAQRPGKPQLRVLPVESPLAASQKPHAGAHGHRFSQGQAGKAPQGHTVPCSDGSSLQTRAPAHAEGYRSKARSSSSAGTSARAEAGTGEGTAALAALPKGKLQAAGHSKGSGALSTSSQSWIHL